MLCSVAGTTTLDIECVQYKAKVYTTPFINAVKSYQLQYNQIVGNACYIRFFLSMSNFAAPQTLFHRPRGLRLYKSDYIS